MVSLDRAKLAPVAAAVMACSGLPTRQQDAAVTARDVLNTDVEMERPPPRITQLATGGRHVCAVDEARDVWCWGSNLFGESAPDLTDIAITRPRRVPGVRATQVAVGRGLSCVLRPEGNGQCWGRNEAGQVVPAMRSAMEPPSNVNARDARQLVVGGDLVLAVQLDAALWGWGDNLQAPVPQELEVTMVREVRAGLRHACAVRADGSVRCVGAQFATILGAVPSARFVATPPLTDARDLAAGVDFTCVLDGAGGVRCWGASAAVVASRRGADETRRRAMRGRDRFA